MTPTVESEVLRPNAATTAMQPAIGASASPTSGPSASDRVRAQLDAQPVVPAEQAAWFPFRILEIVIRASGELPAPAAPSFADDRVVWSLVAPATPTPRAASAYTSVCDEVTRVEPRVLCLTDTVAIGATDRVRMAFGWRALPGSVTADLALPLRALGRLSTGACLRSAERSLHTLELRVEVPNVLSLGTTLALLTAVPHLRDLIMVQAENLSGPRGPFLKVTLAWPTDRADRTVGDMGGDAWPARCDEHATLGAEVPPRSPLTALAVIRGERARGAVVNLARREWLVTDGDQLGDALVTSVTEQGVYVRRGDSPRARAALMRFTTRPPARGPASHAPPPSGPSHSTTPLGPIRISLPPEPPTSSQP